MNAFLGIDLGTSGIKAVIIAPDGTELGSGFKETSLSIPAPGFAEQDPKQWWDACVEAVLQAAAGCVKKPDIGGIGISGQMLGSVLLDKSGQTIGDCIIWMDQRAGKERDYIEETLGLDYILAKTANYPLTSYWAPKLLWLKWHNTDVFEKINKLLFPKDYLKYLLTGEMDIDVTDATGTMLFNTQQRRWEPEIFEKLGLRADIVPSHASESADVIGQLTEKAAKALGLKAGIPVVAGGGDQMCGAVGMGVVKPGIVSSTIGTSGVVFSCTNTCATDTLPRAALSYCHSVPGKWCMYGCTLAAGGSLRWLRDTFFKNPDFTRTAGGINDYDYIGSLAAKAKPGCEGLVFLPYLNGERTPYPDPDARGVFFGLSSRHGIDEICRSVMEGVVFSLKDTVEIIKEYDNAVNQVRASGGGARSRLWLQMQADIFNAEIVTVNITETPAVGAAILAAAGAGYYKNIEEAAGVIVKPLLKMEPQKENVKIYEDYYKTYQALYPALKEPFRSQAGIVDKWL